MMSTTMTTNWIQHLLVVALVCATCMWTASARNALSCIDEDGKAVDWYIGYKFPKIQGDARFATGHAHAFLTSDTVAEMANDDLKINRRVEDSDTFVFLRRLKDLLVKFGGAFTTQAPKAKAARTLKSKSQRSSNFWTASKKLINNPDALIMRTLAPAYDKSLLNKISSIYYNDDPENTEADSREDGDDSDTEEVWTKKNIPSRIAHAKGVLLMDEETNSGVWLTHSVPKFPNVREHILDYPDTAVKFGQTFMCVTFDLKKSGGQLVDHLVNMRPLVYDRYITNSLLAQIPNLKDLDLYRNIRFKRQSNPRLLSQVISTKGGQVVKLYSKPPSFQQDLYGGWIDHDLGADLYVETWRRGSGGVLESSCPKDDFHINNVKDIRYDNNLRWEYLVDHSKWAISDEEEIGTVCIADSNRMQSQFKRGSGAVCIKCPTCWSVFHNSILDTEPCPLKANKGVRKEMNIDPSLPTRIEKYLKSTRN